MVKSLQRDGSLVFLGDGRLENPDKGQRGSTLHEYLGDDEFVWNGYSRSCPRPSLFRRLMAPVGAKYRAFVAKTPHVLKEIHCQGLW